MRAVVLAIVTFVVAWAGLGTLEAKETDDAKLRARVREYTSAGTRDVRRDLVVRELASADAAALARLVREAALSDARRSAAFELAARLRLAGVWDLVRRWSDGPAETAALALAAEAPEPEAGVWLVERWAGAPPGGDVARRAREALDTHRLSVSAVERLGAELRHAERGGAALEILRVQMGIDDACPEDLVARWEAALARHRVEALDFAPDGDDLLAAPGADLRESRAVGRNRRVPAGDWIEPAVPVSAQTGDGVIRLRVLTSAGDGAFVSFALADGSADLRLRCDGRAWYLTEPGRETAKIAAPARLGEWTEIELRVADPKLPQSPGVRDVRVLVDRKELRPTGGWWRFPSSPSRLLVGAATAGDTNVVGGVTWRAGMP